MPDEKQMLKIDKLNQFYGESHTLWDLDLDVPQGQCTCVMGRNGVGKTTLMRNIVGLEKASKGTVTLEGRDITKTPARKRAQSGLALVPQGREIFPLLTVRENMETAFACLPKGEHEVPEAMFELFPVLKEMQNRRGGDLSGGQQQQLAIARALASKPKVLLLDEPTEGIQPSIIREMARTLRRIRDEKGLSIVVSEQVLSFALDVADRVVVIENGQFVHDSPRAGVDEAKVSKFLSV